MIATRSVFSIQEEIPGHLRPVILKPVGRIFEISDSNPIRRKYGKCGRSLSPEKNKGLRRLHGAKTRKMRKMRTRQTRKMRKMRLTGFKVTGFRRPPEVEKAGTVNFRKHPARKVQTRSRQCRPKVPGRFAFPSARNPRICSISRSGKKCFSSNFPGTFPEFSRRTPEQTPETATAFSSFLSIAGSFRKPSEISGTHSKRPRSLPARETLRKQRQQGKKDCDAADLLEVSKPRKIESSSNVAKK